MTDPDLGQKGKFPLDIKFMIILNVSYQFLCSQKQCSVYRSSYLGGGRTAQQEIKIREQARERAQQVTGLLGSSEAPSLRSTTYIQSWTHNYVIPDRGGGGGWGGRVGRGGSLGLAANLSR